MVELYKSNRVSLCKGDLCVEAEGRNADRLMWTIIALLIILVIIGALRS